ncbi:MAG TPA: acetyl-CoA decarbonylase/synthase complex subunit gamma [Planctomycetota bacterium]|nr:acetyl-CoA decarbonylase/synthase complex subunit gamma [Planctomycetota bacterium]
MPLTGLDIFKLLPKTNCGECKRATCLAFAVQLAAKKASLDECPHASDEAKASIGDASAPPMRTVAIGSGDFRRTLGGETVLFRHEEKFHNPPVIAIRITDDLPAAALASRLEAIVSLHAERVGQRLTVDAVAIENASRSAEALARTTKAVAQCVPHAIIIVSELPEALQAAAMPMASRKPLLHAARPGTWEAVARVAKPLGCPVAAAADDLDALAELTENLAKAGVQEIVIDATRHGPDGRGTDHRATLHALTQIRRAAVRRSFRAFGYPTLAFASGGDPVDEAVQASTFLAKYASIVVVDAWEPWQVLPLLTERQNIYADPQKPMQVEQKLYAVGAPDEQSPLLITTNFSLTFFTVEGDVESSRVDAWILPVDTEGTSVLTAFAGDKLNERTIAAAVEKSGAAGRLRHRTMIIPGYVASLSGKVEELTGWQVTVGPRESAQLPKFLQASRRKTASAVVSEVL